MDPNKSKPLKTAKTSWQESVQQVNTLLVPVKEAVVIFRQNPEYDIVAGALALMLSLKKIGRRCQVVSPTPIDPQKIIPPQEQKDIPETFMSNLGQIANFLPKKQLVMTIDFTEGTFSQGDMEKSANGLILTLAPEENQAPIEPLNINSQIIESKPDVIFTIGMENLFNLGDFYRNNQSFFTNTSIINIDNHTNNMNYGKANLIDAKASSVCEMITLMLYDLRFTLDEEISKILYSGMKIKTNNFTPRQFSANMLEAASISLRYQQTR
ncbi:hypothetical protein COV53_05720 [Candidatus Gottesmanbacteria bacterium CG11_big_fil_rev_8_21_14_0_20_37_11]|uniref:DDH domain-containing protein n=1 Tax=Candidatus Gottesmanbacteria bacterium CG11_big_fil_rev_8_21_14_0_20_37_11 TaxID=1974575 RepID=A0A2H0NG98_9BACT|nr:MAG: hypothetical protein COV53_05720 [Candidatus Gottesmanbacteria bacterium CG11_big_fil_rev_8_21_14_0_20_37_11]